MKILIFLSLWLLLLWTAVYAACDFAVGRVSDGDTFFGNTVTVISPSVHVTEDTGFRMTRVRTPERGQLLYKQSTEDLRQFIEGKIVEIKIVPKKRKRKKNKPERMRDRWGRFTVEVFLCRPSGKVNVNDLMRAKGWTHFGR